MAVFRLHSGGQPSFAEHGVHVRLSPHEIGELLHRWDRESLFQDGFPEFSGGFPVQQSRMFESLENVLVQNSAGNLLQNVLAK